jgi:ribonuclease HI
MTIEVYVDGFCGPINPGGIGTYGFVVRRGGTVLFEGMGTVGEGATNNVAEYTAAIQALKTLLSTGLSYATVEIRSDSELLVNQLRGDYGVYSERILPLYQEALRLLRQFEEKGVRVRIRWVPREENRRADALARKAYEEYCEQHPEVAQKYAPYLATEKQRELLDRLGISVSKWVSKRAASRLIGGVLEEEREEGG